jgi:CRISPR-associated protein (TIGR02584 family)
MKNKTPRPQKQKPPKNKTTPSGPTTTQHLPTITASSNASAPAAAPQPRNHTLPPHHDKHTILIALVGTSPAILTETIWALANPEPHTPPILPHRILAITTTTGKTALQTLFRPTPQLNGATPWAALRTALATQGHNLEGRLQFGNTHTNIHTITTADTPDHLTHELDDIRTPADNTAAADFIYQLLHPLTQEPDNRLIASLAGGRKTLGALLAATLTILGREHDLLTHVLVTPPYDTLPGFWFPAQPGPPLKDQKNKTHPPSRANLTLATIPFVPLRNLFQKQLIKHPHSYTQLVAHCTQQVLTNNTQHLHIALNTFDRTLTIGQHPPITLSPIQYLTLHFLATDALQHKKNYTSYKDAIDDLQRHTHTLHQKATNIKNTDLGYHHWLTETHLIHRAKQLKNDDLNKTLNEIRKKIKHHLPNPHTTIQALPTRGRFTLQIPPENITIHDT